MNKVLIFKSIVQLFQIFRPLLLALFILIVMQFGSIRILFKYIPDPYTIPLVILYLASCFGFYLTILSDNKIRLSLRPLVSQYWLFVVLLVFLTGINMIGYTIADNLKSIGMGSDADDALIIGAEALLKGYNPYTLKTYLGNTLSPGPGWIFILALLSLNNLYFLVTPLAMGGMGYLINIITRSYYYSNLFLLLAFSNLLFWESTISGSDLISVGCFFQACLIMIYYSEGMGWTSLMLQWVTLSLVATSRAPYGYLVIVIGLFAARNDFSRGIALILFSFTTLIGIHLVFYTWNPLAYSPIFVLSGTLSLLSYANTMLLFLVWAGVGMLALILVRNTLDSWSFWFWLSFFVPLCSGVLVNLSHNSFDVSKLSGHTIETMPIFVTWLVLKMSFINKASTT